MLSLCTANISKFFFTIKKKQYRRRFWDARFKPPGRSAGEASVTESVVSNFHSPRQQHLGHKYLVKVCREVAYK